MRHYVQDLGKYVGQTVELKGWAYNTRSSGKVKFLEVRDGTASFHVFCFVVSERSSLRCFEKVTRMHDQSDRGCSTTSKASQCLWNWFENFRNFSSKCGLSYHSERACVDYLMENRHLWRLRSKRQYAIMRIRAELVSAIRDFLMVGIYLTDAPIFYSQCLRRDQQPFKQNILMKSIKSFTECFVWRQQLRRWGKFIVLVQLFVLKKSKTRRHLIEFWCCWTWSCFQWYNTTIWS